MAGSDAATLYTRVHVSVNFDYHYLSKIGTRLKADEIKSYDRSLHQLLVNIGSSGGQIEELFRGPENVAERNAIIESVLDQQNSFCDRLSKQTLERLSLLWIAVLGSYYESAELLVRSGADVNELFGPHDPEVLDEKLTLLQALVQMNACPENERLVRLVIDHGADLQARDSKERTALHYAAKRGLVRVARELLEKGADANAADEERVTPLFEAAHSAKTGELLPLLIEHGADVLAKDKIGQNVLHWLSRSPGEEVTELAEFLIEKGASIDDRDLTEYQYQPIHYAVMEGKNKLVKLFLKHGANANALLAQNNVSPLHLAARFYAGKQSRQELPITLLKHGAIIDSKTTAGRTPLHDACQYSTVESIEMLVFAGADVNIMDDEDHTPLDVISPRTVENPKICLMLKLLALIQFRQPDIELEDEIYIDDEEELFKYYDVCFDELSRMKSARFIETCTFFELLTMNQCQIAARMQNFEFETQFRLYELSKEFPIYAECLYRAFERARCHYCALTEKANLINEAFYGYLPYIIVKNIVGYIFDNCCSEVLK